MCLYVLVFNHYLLVDLGIGRLRGKSLTSMQAGFYQHSLRRGPTGPSLLAPATQDKMHPLIIIQW